MLDVKTFFFGKKGEHRETNDFSRISFFFAVDSGVVDFDFRIIIIVRFERTQNSRGVTVYVLNCYKCNIWFAGSEN